MTIVIADPFQTFDTLPTLSTSGTVSIEVVDGYTVLRANVTAGTCVTTYRGFGPTGAGANLALTTMYAGFWLRVHTLTSAGTGVFVGQNSLGSPLYRIVLTLGGVLRLDYFNGSDASTAVVSSAVVSLDVWHWIEVKAAAVGTVSGASFELRIDGVAIGSVASVTCKSANRTIDNVIYGAQNTTTCDHAIRTPVCDDTDYPGYCDTQVLVPNGAGARAEWAQGTGTTFAEVDEVDGSHVNDGDTTYIAQLATSDSESDFTLTDLVGSPAIKAVIPWMICRRVVAASIFVGVLSSGNSLSTTTGDPGTTYVYRALIAATDPNTGVAWTPAGVNAAQVLVNESSLTGTPRVTAMGLFVIVASAIPPGLGPVVGLHNSMQVN